MRNLQDEMADLRGKVGQTASWLLIVALHQEFGVGKERLERIGRTVHQITQSSITAVETVGRKKVIRMLADSLKESYKTGKLPPMDMRVPLIRAPRTGKGKQLRMAGDEAATMTWLVWANAVRAELMFGADRFERLHRETVENYRQFNAWCTDGGEEYAMIKLKSAADRALQENLAIDFGPDDDRPNPLQEQLKIREIIERLIRGARTESRQNAAPFIPFADLSKMPGMPDHRQYLGTAEPGRERMAAP